MRKIINGSRYDTDTAKKMGHWESDQDYTSFYHCEETLYRTKAGKWFIYGMGNAATVYAVRRSDGWTLPVSRLCLSPMRSRKSGRLSTSARSSATPSLVPAARAQRIYRLRFTSRVRLPKR